MIKAVVRVYLDMKDFLVSECEMGQGSCIWGKCVALFFVKKNTLVFIKQFSTNYIEIFKYWVKSVKLSSRNIVIFSVKNTLILS